MPAPLHRVDYTVAGKTFSLFEPDATAVTARYQKGEIPFPYWSQVWPAALGLTEFILQNPHYIGSRQVLELAAGLGLPSLAAALAGAAGVVASDYVPEAVAAMQQTATYHRLPQLQVRLLNWTALPPGLSAHVLLLSDVSYDEALFTVQEGVIRSFLQKGTTVIISTPQRLVARNALLPLLPHCVDQQETAVLHQQQIVPVSIFVLQK